MNKSALRARNYRMGVQRASSARLAPDGGRREPLRVTLPILQTSILREQSRRYHNKLVLINKINHSLAEAASIPELYDRLARSIFYLLPRVHFIYLYRSDPDVDRPHCVYAAQELNRQPQPFDPAARISPVGYEFLHEVTRQCRPVVMHDFSPRQADRRDSFSFIQSAISTPMIRQGRVTGVLQVLSKVRHRFGILETDLMSLASNAAAVAMDNLLLRNDLASTSQQLDTTYDSAVEAWRRALELRDRATESHGGRVAEMTVRLALIVGYGAYNLTHLRFGAQLHDIGKIGVPDSVLLKPGPLDEEDKKIMRKHPVYAYEMLSSIPNFAPILEIPYGHHERWDGQGYPNGLKGEEIPLPARIFAVIDVWDALRSDRPYRSAWPEQQAMSYIRDQSGKHFDPRVVDAFLGMMVEPV